MSSRPNRRAARPEIGLPPIAPVGVELTVEERRHYRRLRQEYIESGAVTLPAVSALTSAAIEAATLDRCREQASQVEPYITIHGALCEHPAHKAAKQANKDYRAALGVLGLTPRAKASARVPAKTLEENATRGMADVLSLCGDDYDPAVECIRINREQPGLEESADD